MKNLVILPALHLHYYALMEELTLPDHAGESPLLSRSGGEKGLRGSGAGTLGVPLEGTWRVEGLLGVEGRLSGTVSPFRAD